MDIVTLALLLVAFGCIYFWGDITKFTRKLKWRIRMMMKPKNFIIEDKYFSYAQLHQALKKAGLETSELIVGIDYTESNKNTGQDSFGGKCLHTIDPDPAILNPVIAKTLEPFDADKLIPCFGFGDVTTTNMTVFPFIQNRPCSGLSEVLEKYNEITPVITLSGPTSFGPIIRKAIEIVKAEKSYHILLIVADGQVTSEKDTVSAIVEASKYPLSIVVVGVGDGPWEVMHEFDDELPDRNFDNFQFVEFHKYFPRGTLKANVEEPELSFAVAALQEIPDQYPKSMWWFNTTHSQNY